MGEVCFYLKDSKAGKKTPIILKFKYNGETLKYYPGQSAEPSHWNEKRQRLKSNKETTADGEHSLNDLLDNLAKECKAAYHSKMKTGVPLPATLKNHLDEFINQNKEADEQKKQKPTLIGLLDKFISGEIKAKKGKERSQSSLDNYEALKKHLMAYEEKYGYKIDFSTVTLEFFDSYTTFLKKHYFYLLRNGRKITGVAHNTIAKDISLLKAVINKGITLGYSANLAHKHEDFSFTEVEVDAVYLREAEVVALYQKKCPSAKLEEAKDLFVFGCFTGMRYGDYSKVQPENIIEEDGEYYIKKDTQKTTERVYVPCHPIVLSIFEKYHDRPNKLPKTISNQKLNDYAKEACRLAGLIQKGRLIAEPGKELWQCVSSHTARRSFATNLFLQGFPIQGIMPVTGHRTEEAFMKYIKVSKLDTAKRLSAHMKKKWNEKLLRVA